MATSRIPPLLQPYTHLPTAGSLTLLTSVLGASTNWLVIRFLCDALRDRLPNDPQHDGAKPVHSELRGRSIDADGLESQEDDEVGLVLVSWMRDFEFWRTEARKVGGLDIPRLVRQKRLAFVDGLSLLFRPQTEPTSMKQQATLPDSHSSTHSGRPISFRTPNFPAQAGPPDPASLHQSFGLTSLSLQHVEDTISRAISQVKAPAPNCSLPKKIVLVLDSPDLLLAAAGSSPSQSPPHTTPSPVVTITAESMSAMIHHLRTQVHSTVISLAADAPLLSPPSPSLPLENDHSAFLVGMAHIADSIMSLRLLDTGFAADVSGVVSISKGYEEEDEYGSEGCRPDWERGAEKELLYHVGGDSVVKVFERGGAGGVG
ncbi:hypothetical protein K432DRAFT_414870 [Lepidopterella palustris CBS 459.81]|uniref:Uncharacterized protein n=1 Tax=Lepidopterella palustris CBS 459.81 TaxID=1314670 RepID=A0A8E2JHU0_9PEZI|nr:hypothetical protein K432DRAFT_414870 [Lepidopterella palustris CBS 459.81]